MQLNSELTEILTGLGKAIPSDFIQEKLPTEDDTLVLHIKTPNVFYRKYKLFISDENGGEEVTSRFSEDELSKVKGAMGQAYFNYFVHYHSQFNAKYYVVIFKRIGTSTKLEVLDADKSDEL